MKCAKVSLEYNVQFLVPIKDLSKFLDLLSNCRRVNRGYLDGHTVNYYADDYEPQISLVDDAQYVSQAEYDKLYGVEETVEAQAQGEADDGLV